MASDVWSHIAQPTPFTLSRLSLSLLRGSGDSRPASFSSRGFYKYSACLSSPLFLVRVFQIRRRRCCVGPGPLPGPPGRLARFSVFKGIVLSLSLGLLGSFCSRGWPHVPSSPFCLRPPLTSPLFLVRILSFSLLYIVFFLPFLGSIQNILKSSRALELVPPRLVCVCVCLETPLILISRGHPSHRWWMANEEANGESCKRICNVKCLF